MEAKTIKQKSGVNKISLDVTAELSVDIMPNDRHEFLMTSKEVAIGYGVSRATIRGHKMEHGQELVEGKHYVSGVSVLNAPESGCWKNQHPVYNADIQPHQVLWTKRGIVRLGFFIKSERARMFRDWAEDLIICLDRQCDLFGGVVPQAAALPPKRYHNFITRDRLLDIMGDVCLIEDRELRLRLSGKLNNIRR